MNRFSRTAAFVMSITTAAAIPSLLSPSRALGANHEKITDVLFEGRATASGGLTFKVMPRNAECTAAPVFSATIVYDSAGISPIATTATECRDKVKQVLAANATSGYTVTAEDLIIGPGVRVKALNQTEWCDICVGDTKIAGELVAESHEENGLKLTAVTKYKWTESPPPLGTGPRKDVNLHFDGHPTRDVGYRIKIVPRGADCSAKPIFQSTVAVDVTPGGAIPTTPREIRDRFWATLASAAPQGYHVSPSQFDDDLRISADDRGKWFDVCVDNEKIAGDGILDYFEQYGVIIDATAKTKAPGIGSWGLAALATLLAGAAAVSLRRSRQSTA